jgi:hypothetical protein
MRSFSAASRSCSSLSFSAAASYSRLRFSCRSCCLYFSSSSAYFANIAFSAS